MRFFHRDHRDVRPRGKAAEHRAFQAFGRDVDELVAALGGQVQRAGDLCLGQRRVDKCRMDARCVQPLDLVLHQRDQRRDDERQPRQQQGRDLIAERLARAGGHDGQRVPSGQKGADDLFLPGAEGVVAEISF